MDRVTFTEQDLKEIGQELRTQDTACTADPMYAVFSTRRVYGIDPQWTDNCVWVDSEEFHEANEWKTKVLDRYYRMYYQEPEGWLRTGYFEHDEFVTIFFTKKAADEFVQRHGHRWPRMHVYAESFHRNHQIIGIRGYMESLAGAEEKA